MDMSVSKLQEIVKDREAWRATVPGVPSKKSSSEFIILGTQRQTPCTDFVVVVVQSLSHV